MPSEDEVVRARAPELVPPSGARRFGLTPQRLFALHGWLGLNFGLLLALICLSGALAALTHEIEWITEPALRINPAGPVRWQETYQALQRAYPNHTIGGFGRDEPSVLQSLAWTSYITAPDGSWAQVRVDPYTAQVVRPATRRYLTDYIRQIHYNFHGVWGAGFYLVCFIAFPLLLSMVSGLLFYKGWWKHLFKLRFGQGKRVFFSSLHRLLGVWSLLFGLIIAITGIWYLVESDLVPTEVAYPSSPRLSPEKLAAHGQTPVMRPLAEFIAAARNAFPELQPTGISLPANAYDTVTLQGRAGKLLMRDRANAVFLDPYDATVVAVRKSSESGAASWWVNAADALHFGYWGGLATKLIWAFLGLCLPALVLSGAWLSWRRAGLVGPKAARSTSEQPWWRRIPVRTWILAPLLLAIAWSCIGGYLSRHAPGDFPPTAVFLICVWTLGLISSGLVFCWLLFDRRVGAPPR